MDTFLPPIENPQGLTKKLAYYFTRRQFGKVLTPVKVHSARMPSAFGMFYAKVRHVFALAAQFCTMSNRSASGYALENSNLPPQKSDAAFLKGKSKSH